MDASRATRAGRPHRPAPKDHGAQAKRRVRRQGCRPRLDRGPGGVGGGDRGRHHGKLRRPGGGRDPARAVSGGPRRHSLPGPGGRPRSLPFQRPGRGLHDEGLGGRSSQRHGRSGQRRANIRGRGACMSRDGLLTIGVEEEYQITDHERYKMLEEELQDVVRSLVIFGLHVHVAIPNPELRIEILNEARYFLPHLLALSTSSPFWMGRNTGLKSYRSVIWSNFPRTGIPPDLSSFDEYQNYVELLVKTGSIDNGKKIWWDLRAHPAFPTLEIRVCDMPTRLEETVCLAALMQAICAKLLQLRASNLGFRKYIPALIAENKWRAIRYGLDGNLIDFGKQTEVPMRDLAVELLEFVDDVVDDLGSRKAVAYLNTILAEGTSADRQLRVVKNGGDTRAVVELLAAETMGFTVPD